jgi:hypothetical protein
MKRIIVALISAVTLLALSAPVVFASQDPPPPTTPDGGCTGPDCK